MDFVEGFGAQVKSLNMDSIPMKGILKNKNGFGSLEFEDLSNKNSEARSELESLKRELTKLKEQAKRDLKVWQDEKSALINEHKSELEKATQDAFAQGEAKGKSDAEKEHLERENEVFAGVQNMMESFEKERTEFYQFAEQGVAKAVTALSQKIVGQWLENYPGAIEESVREALSYIGHESRVRLLLNAEDFAWVQPRVKNWLDIGSGNVQIDLIEENRIGRGGCVLETDSGKIEIRIESLLKDMESIVNKYFQVSDKG